METVLAKATHFFLNMKSSGILAAFHFFFLPSLAFDVGWQFAFWRHFSHGVYDNTFVILIPLGRAHPFLYMAGSYSSRPRQSTASSGCLPWLDCELGSPCWVWAWACSHSPTTAEPPVPSHSSSFFCSYNCPLRTGLSAVTTMMYWPGWLFSSLYCLKKLHRQHLNTF